MSKKVVNPAWSPLWKPVEMPAVPRLAELREQVLVRSEKRKPKWAFRLEPDLAMQLQPHPVPLLSERARALGRIQLLLKFEGVLLHAPAGVGANVFKAHVGLLPDPLVCLKFVVTAAAPDAWALRVNRVRRYTRAAFTPGDVTAVRDRLVSLLDPSRWETITAGMLLSPTCLACGKALTDPASMARLVGPECSGTSSLTIDADAVRRTAALFAN